MSVTKGTEIQGGFGWSISILEAQAHVKLDNSITTKIGESVTFKVEKGRRYVIKAQFIYRETTLIRTAYGGPNCRPVQETLTVLTPYDVAYLVGFAPV